MRRILALCTALTTAQLAHGAAPNPNLHVDPSLDDCEIHFAPELNQAAFRRFTREFGSASAFKQTAPPTTLGRRRLSVGLEYMLFSVDQHSDAWNDTFAHPDATHELGSELAFPKLGVRLGVTDDTDVGVFFAANPRANYGWLGVDVKHALLRQDEELPVTLAVRGAYTKTLFVGDMDMHALTAGVSVGRTLWGALTPYVGVGSELVLARETASSVDLDTEVAAVPHGFAGVELAFWRVTLGLEGQVSALPTLQARLAAVF